MRLNDAASEASCCFSAQGQRTLPDGAVRKLNQTDAARAAGISKHQQVQAVRVANVPTDKFEAAVGTAVTKVTYRVGASVEYRRQLSATPGRETCPNPRCAKN
jgi:hypothetical protein